MRSALTAVANRRAARQRSTSLSAVPPAETSDDYLPELAAAAASIIYKSPLPSPEGHSVFIVNAAALPDTFEVDYDSLLPYVLARLPGEDDLLTGTEYEVVFLAGGQAESATSEKRQGPGIGWYLQAYHVLSRAMRKRLQKLYIVHPRTWVRVLISVFSTVVSPKFRRKIIHVSNFSTLSSRIPLQDLLIPPSAYLQDRRLEAEIESATTGRAFGARHAFPRDLDTGLTRLPRVLRETTSFVLMGQNISTEGLFRIPPHSVLAGVLREAYNRGQKFIVWKEQDLTFAQPGFDPALLQEIKQEDAYGVHLAAALIKTWYRELRLPVFPESSYAYLRTHFTSQGQSIPLQDLVTLYSHESTASCLTVSSREILIRHLLPLLAAVSRHESENKMSSGNLSIIFAMALVRSSNELEDAKISSSIRVLLESSIQQWSELRQALGIDARAFEHDLEAPADNRLYEDAAQSDNEGDEQGTDNEDHRIYMSDDPTNVLPSSKAQIASMLRRTPVPPPKPDLPPPLPRRKPILSGKTPEHQPLIYSAVVGDGHQEDTRAVSTSSQASVDSFSTAGHDSVMSPSGTAAIPEALKKIPLRKSVASETHEHTGQQPGITSSAAPERATIDNVSPTIESTVQDRPPNSETATFRKPSWPASATRLPARLPSLAKPVLPGAQTLSPISMPNGNMAAFPKPRTPSPGLLQRMNSIEAYTAANDKGNSPDDERRYKLTPGKLSLRKASVDDLRRLYEDRVSTVQGLARVEGVKRSNSQS